MRTEFVSLCNEDAVAQFQALSQRSPGRTEEKHGNPRRYCRYPGRDSNRVPSEYASEPICLKWPFRNRGKACTSPSMPYKTLADNPI